MDLFLAAGVLALLPWIDVPLTGVRPLVDQAKDAPMDVALRTLGGVSPPVAVAITFALVLGMLLAVRRLAPQHSGAITSALVSCALLSVASVRVLLPLASLPHESDLARLHAAVEDERAAGRPIRYPIRIPESEGYLRIRYYFGRRFVVEQKDGVVLVQGEKPQDLSEQ